MFSPKLHLNRLAYRLSATKSAAAPVYVFHHLPKCAGSSVTKALGQWFRPVYDYRRGWSSKPPTRVDLDSLTANHCLCGHFDCAPMHLDRRYPGILHDARFRVFTFVRDPLAAKISLYHYERRFGRTQLSLDAFLLERPNYLASCVGISGGSLARHMDRYFFVGTDQPHLTGPI